MNFLNVIMMSVFGILLIATYASGASLATTSQLNELETLEVSVTSSETLMGMNLGTASTIDSVTLTFRNALAVDTTVTISIKDSAGTEIGSGSKVLSTEASVVTVDLSDTITSAERPDVRSLSITTS